MPLPLAGLTEFTWKVVNISNTGTSIYKSDSGSGVHEEETHIRREVGLVMLGNICQVHQRKERHI